MQHETTKGDQQTSNTWHLHLDQWMTWQEIITWLFSSTTKLQFHCFQILKLLQCKFKCNVKAKNNYEQYYTEKWCWIKQRGSHMTRECIWELNSEPITSDATHCVCFMLNSKGYATWSWLRLIDPYFFVAWEFSPNNRAKLVSLWVLTIYTHFVGLFGSS